MLYAMEPTDADWYTLGGFWLSVVGLVVGWAGLAATYWQVRLARRSADAARDAAEATRMESVVNFRRFLAATIHRQLSEVETFVGNENWVAARLRCDDLADVVAQLSEQKFADEFRKFANTFRRITAGGDQSKVYSKSKWDDLMLRIKRRVDLLNAPFGITVPNDSN